MKKRDSRGPLIEVRHSPIHGYGVFALRRIRKGTTIMEYVGERVTHEEADARYEDKDANDNHTFLFTVDSKTVIDGGVGGNDARFINHGCDPNCESTSQRKRIYVEAVKTIQPGEELAYDYQIQRDETDPPNVDEIFACRCGAEKCRGSMLVARKKPRTRPGVMSSAARKTVKRGVGGKAAKKTGPTKTSAKATRQAGKKRARAPAKKKPAGKKKSPAAARGRTGSRGR